MAEVRIIQVPEDQDVLCPVCGVTILDSEELHEQPSCPHIRFIYANGECFEYCQQELEAILTEEEAKADGEDDFFDVWETLKHYCGPENIILEQRSEEMACGPVSFTVWFGIRGAHRPLSNGQ